MRSRPVILVLGVSALALGVVFGCSSVDQLMDPDPRFETLIVAYGDPGPSPSPCDDVLPIVDGNPTDLEWSFAEPLFVRMSGADGNGGSDFFLEVRAIWTDESKTGGEDRIYFMVRYPDNELNAFPDLMGYIRPRGPDELCDNLVEIEGAQYCTSPVPMDPPGPECDSVAVYPVDSNDPRKSWTRLNKDGREDQVMLIFSAATPEAETNLRETNGDLLGVIGPEVPSGYSLTTGEENLDIWIWRAGRTNLHPIPQFPNWGTPRDAFTNIPEAKFSVFGFNSGFAEDLWIEPGGALVSDVGTKPFTKNYNKIDFTTGEIIAPDVPLRIPRCPPPGREPSEDEVAAANGGISKDLALWWDEALNLTACDSLACSRTGRAFKWSQRLLPGEFDKVMGWGLVIPHGSGVQSSRDVRARGTFEATQEKGFGVQSLEFMRLMDTQNPDDLVIDPTGNTVEYRMVIGVLNNSGRVGSGSTEIRLRFEAPINRRGVSPRC